MLSEGVQLDQLVGGARSRLWRLAVQRVRNQITVKQQALQLPCEADVVWQSVGESIVAQELKVARREEYVRAAGEQAPLLSRVCSNLIRPPQSLPCSASHVPGGAGGSATSCRVLSSSLFRPPDLRPLPPRPECEFHFLLVLIGSHFHCQAE